MATIVFLIAGVMAVCAMSFIVPILFILRCSNYLEYCCEAGQDWRVQSDLLSAV